MKPKTLAEYLALPRVTNNHFRYMDEAVKHELIQRTPRCNGGLDERVYWLQNGLLNFPTCRNCGKELSSSSWYASTTKAKQNAGVPSKGYRHFCSRKCSGSSDEKKQKIIQTSMARYGVPSSSQAEVVKARMKLTNLERYGASNPMAWSSDRFKRTIERLHGVTSVRHIPGVHEKIALKKRAQTLELLAERVPELESKFNVKLMSDIPKEMNTLYDVELLWKHSCGREYSSNISIRGLRKCPSCTSGSSKGETAVGDWLESLGVQINRRDRSQGRELDIWLPDRRIGIEYDGMYWHSARFVTAEKSLEKLLLIENNGGQLITLQEHLWLQRQELVKHRIKSVLGMYERRVAARNTKIIELECGTANELLSSWHLQGGARASYALALEADGETIAVMTFSAPRFSKTTTWELVRYACKPGVQVIGGASKLHKRFLTDRGGTILSYADRCWSQGGLYAALGYSLSHISPPSYYWVSNSHAFSRYQTQKAKLSTLFTKLGYEFDPAFSEGENMRSAGFLQIFDRGNQVWTHKGLR